VVSTQVAVVSSGLASHRHAIAPCRPNARACMRVRARWLRLCAGKVAMSMRRDSACAYRCQGGVASSCRAQTAREEGTKGLRVACGMKAEQS
jgi:hypothetical protein